MDPRVKPAGDAVGAEVRAYVDPTDMSGLSLESGYPTRSVFRRAKRGHDDSLIND